jgi:hypothetical protein
VQSRSHRPRPIVAPVVIVTTILIALGWARADAATVTASYTAGYRNVTINGYGAAGMGTFTLRDGTDDRLALCVEANVGHSTTSNAYTATSNKVSSPELDALLWWLDRQPPVDDDTAIAAAALAWYYAGAVRTIGPPVWSDGHRNFAPIGPLSPEPWDALPRFSMSHMIGLVAGGAHLDAAERRVAELHRLATKLAGPWKLTSDAANHSFRLTGRNGPIAGRLVSVTIESTGSAAISRTTTTDTDGVASVDLPRTTDGATVRAVVAAPGTHREWDGTGAIQRMATPTSTAVEAAFSIAPLARHVRVVKRSTDPTIGVAGARFELRDATGRVVDSATSDASGRADFAPIDPATSPPPYEVAETNAPPGLVTDTTPQPITDASTRASDPTLIEVVNEPATVAVQVRKRLSIPDVGPRDLSGFRFVATRREDGTDHDLETRSDGSTNLISVPIGTYEICETGAPEWADSLIDGGCVELVVDVTAVSSGEPFVVGYTNDVPDHTIDTSASERADGDRSMFTSGGTVIDEVRLAGLVPQTAYTLIGEAIAVGDQATPTGVIAEATFTATAPDHRIDLAFEMPAREPGPVVIVERLLVGDHVVAVHDDLSDGDQTITVIAPPSTTTTTTTTTAPPTTTPPTTTNPTTTSATALSTTTSTTATRVPTTAPATAPPTLPPTGTADATGLFLRIGDLGFVVGVGLVVLAGLAPRRRTRA